MTYQLPKSFKNCLTCTYWCGMRRLILMERYAETNDFNTKGMCANCDGFYHLEMSAFSSCSQHESMPALRD